MKIYMDVRIFPDEQPEAAGLSVYTTLAWIDRWVGRWGSAVGIMPLARSQRCQHFAEVPVPAAGPRELWKPSRSAG